jgi:hypothetical protein
VLRAKRCSLGALAGCLASCPEASIMESRSNNPYNDELNQDYSYIPFNVSIAFIVLIAVAYALRFWARYVRRIHFALDDWIMIPAFVAQIALDIASMSKWNHPWNGRSWLLMVCIVSATYGSGRHASRVFVENDWHFTYWGIYALYVIPFLYQPCVTLPKISILILYLRVFPGKFSRWCCYFIMFILLANASPNILPPSCNAITSTTLGKSGIMKATAITSRYITP